MKTMKNHHPHEQRFIREEESLTFSDLQALLKIPIRLQVDSAYRHGQYDIALG